MSRLDRLPIIERAVPISDVEVKGRTVTAYAATFDDPYPVADFDGRYDEIINRAAFNRHLGQHGISRIKVMMNHGMTPFMTPSERFSLPVAVPQEVRPDGRGLLTVSRYANTELADEILQLIDDGVITTQSFRGPVIRSAPARQIKGRRTIERLELGIIEYGPVALLEANPNAKIVALRSALTVGDLDELTDEEKQHLRELLQIGTQPEPEVEDGPPVEEPPDTPDTTDQVPVADPSTNPDMRALANRQRRRRETEDNP